jgi:cellulose synthase/poly-beta-1,6-N-acetylglucosamine synthase-like glycosyltransferase
LRRLVRLPERPPIVVVDNGSSDGTGGMVRERFPEVALLELGENRGAEARSIAVAARPEPYIAFADDDSWWEPGSVAAAAELLARHPRVGLVAARVTVGADGHPDPVCRSMELSPLPTPGDLPGPAVLGFLACGAAVRREAFLQAGGFHPRLGIGGEEWLLAVDMAALGWELVYTPTLGVRHCPPGDRDGTARRVQETRNALWCAWLRRPVSGAWRQTLDRLRGARDPAVRRGMAAALLGGAWVLRERRPVGAEVERRLIQLDRAARA